MRRFCPSLTDLQAFEVAARHSSFTRAAQELCVTQGAVSKQVKHLEEFVGVELFLRIRQGLVLTEAGRSYLTKIQAGLGPLEAATVELIAHQGQGGTLNLTCMPTFGARWLIPRLTAFMRLRPDIHVEFLPHRQGYDFSTPELDAAPAPDPGRLSVARGLAGVSAAAPHGGAGRLARLVRAGRLRHAAQPGRGAF
ncbi:hypothetical protein G6F22_017416 [Rhizopus arrhizus]|nr:hypothetical protein G6F22_017416 [Rhizopus arrhizus]